ETLRNARDGNYQWLKLTRRVHAMPPAIECINTRGEPLIEGLSQTLLHAVHTAMQRGEQSLIYINRRGYAQVLMCPACGWISGCQRCSSKLVLHAVAQRLHCHLCGHEERVPAACPDCGNAELQPIGHGTQRIESALARVFPRARLLRIDRDSTRRKHA